MSLTVVLDALALPANAKVEQRIPKKLLVEQGAPTAADKRQIQDGIEELQWVAALKPTNIAVPASKICLQGLVRCGSGLLDERDAIEIASAQAGDGGLQFRQPRFRPGKGGGRFVEELNGFLRITI